MKKIENVVLADLLPQPLTEDPNVTQIASAIDPELKTVSGFINLGAVYANVSRLTSKQLDHLAYCFDLTTWRDSWPVERKREIAKTVVAQKCRMGTLSAIKQVLASLGSAVEITEWFQKTPKGEPHTFEVIASLAALDGELTAQEQEDFFRLLNEAKPVRSHYTFSIFQNIERKVQITGAARSVAVSRISQERQPLSATLQIVGVSRALVYSIV